MYSLYVYICRSYKSYIQALFSGDGEDVLGSRNASWMLTFFGSLKNTLKQRRQDSETSSSLVS